MTSNLRRLSDSFVHIPFIKNMIARRQAIQEWYTPNAKNRIEKQTRRSLLVEMIYITVYLVIVGLAWHLNVENVILVLAGIYCISKYYQFRYIRIAYRKLLIQFEHYLALVRNIYQNTNMLEEALQEALWESEEEIACHIQDLIQQLNIEEPEQMQEYKEKIGFSYLLTFFILCKTCIVYGDSYSDEKSNFLCNMNQLKEEIHNELLRRNRINHIFSGLLFVCAFPIIFIDWIRDFSLWNLPELLRYYDGGYGLVVKLLIAVTTICVIRIIEYLMEPRAIIKQSHYVLDKLLQKDWIRNFILQRISKQKLLYEKLFINLERIRSDYSILHFVLLKYLFAFITSILVILTGILILYRESRLHTVILSLLFTETKITISHDQSSVMLFIFISIILIFFAYRIPNIQLTINLACQKSETQDEIMRLQAVLIMLTPISRMTVEILLEWLAFTSDIFQPMLLNCMDGYLQDDQLALEELYQSTNDEDFKHMIRNLEVSDRIGILHAFEEVPGDYAFSIEKRKQDNEIQTDNKGAIGRFIAFAPMVLIIGGYLIIPFVLESIIEFMGYVKQMQGI